MRNARSPAIVGASIAGGLLALRLARAGIPNTVLEARKQPWAKVCGEGLHPVGRRAVEEVLGSVAHMGWPLRGFRFTDADAELIAVDHGDSEDGLGCDRLRLESHIWDELARQPLVDFRPGCAVVDGSPDAHGWMLRTPRGSLPASHVVGADGVRSRVREFAGRTRGPARGRWGVRQRLRIAGRTPSVVEICFLEDCQVFVTPLGEGRVSIAALGDEARIRELRDPVALATCLGRMRAGPDLGSAEPEEDPHILPHCGQRARSWCADRLYLVGDAAAFLDPISGSGMTLAALSSRTVANTLTDVLRHGCADRVAERRAARELGRQVRPFRNLTRFLRALAGSPTFRRASLAVLRRTPGLVHALARPTAAVPRPDPSAKRGGSATYQMFS